MAWGASAAGGIGVIVYEPYPRLGLQVRQLEVSAFDAWVWQFHIFSAGGLLVHSAYTRGCLYIITPFSLKKKDNSVVSVGSVGKSEKSPEISQ